jgi:hypothetical protein
MKIGITGERDVEQLWCTAAVSSVGSGTAPSSALWRAKRLFLKERYCLTGGSVAALRWQSGFEDRFHVFSVSH